MTRCCAITAMTMVMMTSCTKEENMPEPQVEPVVETPVPNHNFVGDSLVYDYELYMSAQWATDNCIPLDIIPGEAFTTCNNAGTGVANGEMVTGHFYITIVSDTSYRNANSLGKLRYCKTVGNTLMISHGIIGQQPWIDASNANYQEYGTVVHETSTHKVMDKPLLAGGRHLFGFTKK